MAGSVNKVILLGHLGRDPEIRTPGGMAGDDIATLNVATSESWKDRNTGERKEKTEWHRVVIFNPILADIAKRYLKKGSAVYIEGAVQTRKWTDNQGAERYTTEVVISRFKGELVLLGGGNGGDRPPPADSPGDYGTSRSRTSGGVDPTGRSTPPPDDGLDDEIPF